MATIATVFSTLDTARNMAGALIGIRDEQQVRSKVIELQAIILDAQGSALAAQRDMMELQDRLDEAERGERENNLWVDDSARYSLTDFGAGTFAYKLVEPTDAEPDHSLCPRCYGHKIKSILQFRKTLIDGRKLFDCTECKTEFHQGATIRPSRFRDPIKYPNQNF